MPDDRFAPPPEDKRPIELEREWAGEKAGKQATATMAEPARRSPRTAWIITAIALVVAGVIAAGVVVQRRSKPDVAADVPRPEGTIGIQIRANPQAQIRIDGHMAGKTPMTVHMKKGTQQVRIDAVIDGKTQTKLVVPDQDQDVGFTR